jgi:hypothetical protein
MPNLEIGTCQKIYCNTCKVETHHELKAVYDRVDELVSSTDAEDEYTGFEEEWEYRLWLCRGCDTATLEEAYTNTGMLDHKARHNVWKSTLYPKRERRDWSSKRFRQLDAKLASIYREVIESFNADLRILCAVGLRALLEGICAEKGIKGKNLYKKIDGLKAHLPPNIVESLHSFRFMGNEAAHELQSPSRADLQLAIEVIEDLLNFMYELDYKARGLALQIGARRSSPSLPGPEDTAENDSIPF